MEKITWNTIGKLATALADMEDAAALKSSAKAREAARKAEETGLMKHGGPAFTIFLMAREGSESLHEMRLAADVIRESLADIKALLAAG